MYANRKKAKMWDLYLEIGKSQLTKHNERLCGDSIIIDKDYDRETASVILSDGLGSGVKANILSTLTTKIISVMLQNGRSIDEIVDTLTDTLPTCNVRQLAYSTFSVAQFGSNGKLQLVEYDNPPAFFVRNGKVVKLNYKVRDINGKKINETSADVQVGDLLVFVSDGETHAGIGGVWNLGWGWDQIAEFIERISKKPMSAKELAFEITNIANELYAKKPGDDTSAVVVKIRKKNFATMLVGAPQNPEHDKEIVNKLIQGEGRKIICGGTTSNIVSRELNEKLEVDLSTLASDVPPIGVIKGIDLCTEGIITISRALEMLKSKPNYKKLEISTDGVSRLVRELLLVDEITIMIGQALNDAHQTSNMPKEFGMKRKIMESIGEHLTDLGKAVHLEYY